MSILKNSPANTFASCILALILLSFLPQAAVWVVPVFSLALILVTRRAAAGLFFGTFLGAYAINAQHVGSAIIETVQTYLFGALSGPWHVSAILFTLILGSFAAVLHASGGFAAIAKLLLGKKNHSARRIESAAGGLGILCFFDGLANSMLVGQLARPLYDKVGIARARLAYLVDSTSSAVACVSFISTWIAMQLSLIQGAIDDASLEANSYQLFFRSIPQNYYCWFTLVMVALVIWRQWNIGPMEREKPRRQADSPNEGDAQELGSLWQALGPLLVLILGIIVTFYLWGTETAWPISGEKLVASFGGSAGPYALTIGSILGLTAAVLWAPRSKKDRVKEATKSGAANMLPPLIILIAAWSFGSMLKDLGTALWLSDHIVHLIPATAYPLAIFLTGAVISLCTGSSWGTMGLLMPIALGTWLELNPGDVESLPTIIAAVFSGAVFGDHCSPFSDTTIVSSFASGVSTDTHVKTQAPYALITALITAVFGFGAAALGLPPFLNLVLGMSALVALVYLTSRKPA